MSELSALIPSRVISADDPESDPMDPAALAWLQRHGLTPDDMVTSVEIYDTSPPVALIHRAVCGEDGTPLLVEAAAGRLATTATLIEINRSTHE